MASQNDVISVIVSFNDVRNTHKAVSTLLNQTVRTKIVVWDNNSSDNTLAILKKDFDNEIIIHESKENCYWTPAINESIRKYYDGEKYIHWSNNDIAYPERSLERLILDINETKAGMVGPTGSAIGGLQDYAVHQRHLDGDFINFSTLYAFLGSKKPTQASSIQGACVLVSSESFNKVGFLDENMPLGADDFDYSIRMKDAGYGLFVSEKAYVFHKGHASGPGNEKQWDDIGSKSWDFFNEKYEGYYFNELEALRCMWEHKYYLGWDTGTGWLSEEDRLLTWNKRGVRYDGSPIHSSES